MDVIKNSKRKFYEKDTTLCVLFFLTIIFYISVINYATLIFFQYLP